MYLLGYDVGSSSVKAALLEADTGTCVGSASSPADEMAIEAPCPGYAEQHPELWWRHLVRATAAVLKATSVRADHVRAIGIAYQMHGLVLVDEHGEVLRPAIIWCDSRAVPLGEDALESLGFDYCQRHLLNSPGNFTASKLAWVKASEPSTFARVDKMMLPGDWIAMRMTGTIATTVSGLSEGMLWDFVGDQISAPLLRHFELNESLLPDVVPTFGPQGSLTRAAASELGLEAGIPVSYRAGDQPNNALSLNVLEPGTIAATAGTSGVVYGISDIARPDPRWRVNTFAHVNHASSAPRFGVLLCINGTGILNAWLRRQICPPGTGYDAMNAAAQDVPIGSDGVVVLPFGNGAERLLENRDPGCQIHGVSFTRHQNPHLLRAAQEGIAFAFRYGLDVLGEAGIEPRIVRAGSGNLFASPIFRQALTSTTGAAIELFETDGAEGAARGAGLGAGVYGSTAEAFAGLVASALVEPDESLRSAYSDAYDRWCHRLEGSLAYHDTETRSACP
jgi:xylulokinase